jgi:hypothetical protein
MLHLLQVFFKKEQVWASYNNKRRKMLSSKDKNLSYKVFPTAKRTQETVTTKPAETLNRL